MLIIEIEKKLLLLSVTDNNISILKELDGIALESDELSSQNTDVKFSEILKENLLNNKITSKLMKGNINYESDKFNNKKD